MTEHKKAGCKETAPKYAKGDLRRMLMVLGAIQEAGGATLVQIAVRSGLDKKTVSDLIVKAREQASVAISKTGSVYCIESWGPVFKCDGAKKALQGALNTPIIEASKRTNANGH